MCIFIDDIYLIFPFQVSNFFDPFLGYYIYLQISVTWERSSRLSGSLVERTLREGAALAQVLEAERIPVIPVATRAKKSLELHPFFLAAIARHRRYYLVLCFFRHLCDNPKANML